MYGIKLESLGRKDRNDVEIVEKGEFFWVTPNVFNTSSVGRVLNDNQIPCDLIIFDSVEDSESFLNSNKERFKYMNFSGKYIIQKVIPKYMEVLWSYSSDIIVKVNTIED